MLTLMTVFTVIPIIATVIYIIYQGWPAISWEFISEMPREGMRAGGIWPAILGTFYLTIGTAVFSVPIGIAAAIYLSEYAHDNRWTRADPSGNYQPRWNSFGGLWSLRPGIVRALSEFWYQHSGWFIDPGHHDFASDHQHRRRSYSVCAAGFPYREYLGWRYQMADDPPDCAAASLTRLAHRRDLGTGKSRG